MRKKVRVLQLIGGINIGSRDGGAEYFGLQLSRFLNPHEFDVAVFVMWYYGSTMEQKWLDILRKEKIRVAGLTMPSHFAIYDLLPIYKQLWHFVSEFKPDIVHSHSQRGDLLCAALKWFHPLHPIIVRTVHVDQPWLNRYWTELLFNQIIFPWTFDGEIAVSDAIRNKLNRRWLASLSRTPPLVCYNGVDARLFEEGLLIKKKEYNLDLPPGVPNVSPRIGFIGRLVKQKGITYLLQAMSIVNQHYPAFLLIIGAGPLESELRQQVQENGLEDKVFFLGRRDDVLQILPHLDIVVLPSLWEGLSTVMLEAMAFRVPVIATNVSGSREVIRHGETGLLVPPKDPVALAQSMLSILDNRANAQRMAERAYITAQNYTIQNTARCYSEIYQKLLGFTKKPDTI